MVYNSPYFKPRLHKFGADMHGNCFVCGDGEQGPYHYETDKDFFDLTGVKIKKDPLPDRILAGMGRGMDWFFDLLGSFFSTYVGRWLAVLGVVAFIIFALTVLYGIVILTIGTFIYGWDVCASGVLPWDIVYTDGGCS